MIRFTHKLKMTEGLWAKFVVASNGDIVIGQPYDHAEIAKQANVRSVGGGQLYLRPCRALEAYGNSSTFGREKDRQSTTYALQEYFPKLRVFSDESSEEFWKYFQQTQGLLTTSSDYWSIRHALSDIRARAYAGDYRDKFSCLTHDVEGDMNSACNALPGKESFIPGILLADAEFSVTWAKLEELARKYRDAGYL